MVQRRAGRGPKQGGFFWACSRYPACRMTIDIPAIGPTPDPLTGAPLDPGTLPVATSPDLELQSGVIGVAGGSAQSVYDRRKRRFDQTRWDRLVPAVGVAVVAATVTFVLIERSNQVLAVVSGATIAAVILLRVLIPPQTTTAWVTGAEGEEATARLIDPLAQQGFVVIHDRKIPGSPRNIDHIVIGPTGVFVIETKNVAGRLRIEGGDLRIGGRRVAAVDEVLREAAAVSLALAPMLSPRNISVRPVICAHRADLPWFRREVRGVRIVSGRDLVRLIRGSDAVLSADEVLELSRLAVRNLPGAEAQGSP